MVGIDQSRLPNDGQESGSDLFTVRQIVESVVGCKWALAILEALRRGVARPGEIERSCDGLSSKVMYERLRKLERFGLVQRFVHEVVPPHVEYRFTPRGERFLTVLDAIDAVQRDFDSKG